MDKFLIIFPLIVLSAPLAFAESSNVGIIYWEKEIVSINSFADIIVKDNDMNKKEYPNFADKFTITVWSDTSPDGLEIQVVENGVYSGIFKGSVYIADSGEPTKNRLISSPGDVLYAKYVDSTLPDGGSSEIISAAVVKISGEDMSPILNKIDPSMRHLKTPQSEIPAWVKNNAGWWADGTIAESDFISGIEFLIKDGIIVIPPTTVSSESSEGVPAWVKNNAGWWADGTISDGEFVNGIQHLIKTGLISVSSNTETTQMVSEKPKSDDSKLASLEAELEKCSEIKVGYKRIDCEKPLKKAIALYKYQTNAQKFEIGPITYYWFGVGSEGNGFEISPTGQAILSIRMLAENTSSEITALHCTSPSICSYDVWDGTNAFKYSGMDFTSGEIVLNPNDSREFNILFGPNIGYGGTEFKYDPSKTYYFRINENFGSVDIPLELK
ncbi:hypothetical protein [Nitrosopumilus adriaticus]|uniref:Phage head-tail adaptor (Modular protein) n=1 Tax=Nitrosopumilus adriaticus TaxID=1580092 RepID=A0A0D5C2V3_9ARCH|nr:hypothetical protein [Nitrosopumilus adriaticus]AJW70670.1 Putative phage head-tail adaptor (modular protein) [Nitrosopumilus adriaticus]